MRWKKVTPMRAIIGRIPRSILRVNRGNVKREISHLVLLLLVKIRRMCSSGIQGLFNGMRMCSVPIAGYALGGVGLLFGDMIRLLCRRKIKSLSLQITTGEHG